MMIFWKGINRHLKFFDSSKFSSLNEGSKSRKNLAQPVWISLLKPKDGGPQWASKRLQGIQLERKNETGIELVRYHWPVRGSSDPSYFIFKINVGKGRIQHSTTLKLNDELLDRLKIDRRLYFRVVPCRIRLFPFFKTTLNFFWKWLSANLELS